MLCQAKNKNGKPCKNHVKAGRFCKAHTPAVVPQPIAPEERCTCLLLSGAQCSRRKMAHGEYCSRHRNCYRSSRFESTELAGSQLPAEIVALVEEIFSDPENFRNLEVMHVLRGKEAEEKYMKIIQSGNLTSEYDFNKLVNGYACMYFTLYFDRIFKKYPQLAQAFQQQYQNKYFMIVNGINHFYISSRMAPRTQRFAHHRESALPTLRVAPGWAWGRGTNLYSNDGDRNINLSPYAIDRIKNEFYMTLIERKSYLRVDPYSTILDALVLSHEVTLCRILEPGTGRGYYVPLDMVDVRWHLPGDPVM